MKIQYLGTAAAEGIPGIFCRCELCRRAKQNGWKDLRTRSQAVIDGTLLLDFPPDSYHHMLAYGLDLPNIQHILFTHSHQDHFYGLDLTMRGFGFANEVENVLHFYGNDAIGRAYQEIAAPIAKAWKLDELLEFTELTEFIPVRISGYQVTPLLANHDKREKCLIYLVEQNGKCILYANDTGWFPEKTWEYLKDKKIDLLSMDCTMGKFKEATNHMGLPDTVEMYSRLLEMGCIDEHTKTVITHFSHNGQMLHADLEAAAAPYGFLVAYDGMTVEI